MQQLALITFEDRALEAAKRLIRAYVKRGDGYGFLRDMGSASPQSYSVSIGGYLDGKKYSDEKILVMRDMDGNKVNKVYSKREVFNMILEEK